MIKKYWVIVLYDEDGNKTNESLEFNEYPPVDSIEFGLGYEAASYAKVEERYKMI